MRSIAIVTLIVLASWSGAAADQRPSPEPVLRVGVFGYKPDGGVSLAAWDPQPSTNSIVYIRSLCEVGGGSYQAPPARATDAWRFSGKILNMSPEEAQLELDWQRIVDRGQAVTAPAGSLQVTVRVGEKVVLDPVVPDEPSQCSIISAAFEVRYDESPVRTLAAGGGRATTEEFPNPQHGGVTSSGGGRLVIVKPRSSSGGAKHDRQPLSESATPMFDVNLWLVHRVPGKPDEVLHQALRAPRLGAPFAFSPVTIETPHGAMVVQVTGSFEIETAASGDDRLVFVTKRRVTPARFNPSVRDTLPNSEGGSRTTTIMPGPEDVLAFEMPAIRVKGQRTADQFSVRARITPH